MKTFGLLFVVFVFALAMTAVVYHYAPSIAETAIKLPTHQADGWKANTGWAVSWSMVIFGVMALGGYKLVKR